MDLRRPPAPGKLLVQSVDFFRAFWNDPYILGKVGACALRSAEQLWVHVWARWARALCRGHMCAHPWQQAAGRGAILN